MLIALFIEAGSDGSFHYPHMWTPVADVPFKDIGDHSVTQTRNQHSIWDRLSLLIERGNVNNRGNFTMVL